MSDVRTTAPDESVPRWIARFVSDLWRITIFQPVRYGTLDLGVHSRGVAGIAWAVVLLYTLTIASIVFAGPLRSSSPLLSSIGATSAAVVPTFLLPAALCLLAVAFGLLLAGSQRAPWWRRILYLIVIGAVLATVSAVGSGLGSSVALSRIGVGLLIATLGYIVLMWFGRTPAALDAVILVALSGGILLVSYRSIITQTLLGEEGGPAVTTVVIVLSQVSSLALPVAFLSGVNAAALGVSVVSWTGEQIGLRSVTWVAATVVAVGLSWQWIAVVASAVQVPDEVGMRLLQVLPAAVLLAACAIAWWLCRRGLTQRESSPVTVTDAGVAVAVPVAFVAVAPSFIASLLSAVIVGLQLVAPAGAVEFASSLLEATSTTAFTVVIRGTLIAGLTVGAVILVRRGARLWAAFAAIDAVVLGTYYLRPFLPEQVTWTPSALGDVGLIAASVLAVVWTLRRRWDRRHAGFLVLLTLLSALIRQADFFAIPMGFVIGASATAVLMVGLVWGFLTDGGEAHTDRPRFPRDRHLLIVLGTFLFGIAIVAWALIGKDVGTTQVLSGVSLLAVETLGSALIIAVVLSELPRRRPNPTRIATQIWVSRGG